MPADKTLVPLIGILVKWHWPIAREVGNEGGPSWKANLALTRVALARLRPEGNFVRLSVERQRLVFLAPVHMRVAAARHEVTDRELVLRVRLKVSTLRRFA